MIIDNLAHDVRFRANRTCAMLKISCEAHVISAKGGNQLTSSLYLKQTITEHVFNKEITQKNLNVKSRCCGSFYTL